MDISIGDERLYNLHFLDEQAILQMDKSDIYYILLKTNEERDSCQLTINPSMAE